MLVPDVNVLLYAYFEDSPGYRPARAWLDSALAGREIVGTPDVVLSAFIRIATNQALFAGAPSMAEAFAAVESLREPPTAVQLAPGAGHWDTFRRIALDARIGSKDVSDAYLAALAIENDATFVTFDRGFERFPGLRVFVPG